MKKEKNKSCKTVFLFFAVSLFLVSCTTLQFENHYKSVHPAETVPEKYLLAKDEVPEVIETTGNIFSQMRNERFIILGKTNFVGNYLSKGMTEMVLKDLAVKYRAKKVLYSKIYFQTQTGTYFDTRVIPYVTFDAQGRATTRYRTESYSRPYSYSTYTYAATFVCPVPLDDEEISPELCTKEVFPEETERFRKLLEEFSGKYQK